MKTLLTVIKTLVMFEAQCVWNQIKWDTEFLTLGTVGLCERRLGFSHCRDHTGHFSGQSIFPGEGLDGSCLKGSVDYHQRVMETFVISDFLCEHEDSGIVNLTHFPQSWSALSAAHFFAVGGGGGALPCTARC